MWWLFAVIEEQSLAFRYKNQDHPLAFAVDCRSSHLSATGNAWGGALNWWAVKDADALCLCSGLKTFNWTLFVANSPSSDPARFTLLRSWWGTICLIFLTFHLFSTWALAFENHTLEKSLLFIRWLLAESLDVFTQDSWDVPLRFFARSSSEVREALTGGVQQTSLLMSAWLIGFGSVGYLANCRRK